MGKLAPSQADLSLAFYVIAHFEMPRSRAFEGSDCVTRVIARL